MQTMPDAETPAPVVKQESSSVMVVHPQERAKDYIEAFDALRKDHSNMRITFTLKDNTKITNVTSLRAMKEGTLLLFQTTTPQGVQYKVVNVESIKSIEHS